MVVCFPWKKIEAITKKVGENHGSWQGKIYSSTHGEDTTAIVKKYRPLVRALQQIRVEQIILSGILPVMGSRGQGY